MGLPTAIPSLLPSSLYSAALFGRESLQMCASGASCSATDAQGPSYGNQLAPSLPPRTFIPAALESRVFIPAAMETPKSGNWRDLVIGPALQCMEAATLGMPFEVWKTRMGRFRSEGTIESLLNVYKSGGVGKFWAGTDAKMVESALKGAILMYSKEAFNNGLAGLGVNPGLAGALAGAGGGACQVVIMGPCTFLVTGKVTGDPNESTMSRIRRTYAAKGVKGFYPGGTAIAARQMTNWASRQGFTEAVRDRFKVQFHGDKEAKLTKGQEVGAGIIGGMLACWNHPFEVARIEMQARGDQGQKSLNMIQVFKLIVAESGPTGLFTGIVPRMLLGVWQTLFMVTGAKLVKDALAA